MTGSPIDVGSTPGWSAPAGCSRAPSVAPCSAPLASAHVTNAVGRLSTIVGGTGRHGWPPVGCGARTPS